VKLIFREYFQAMLQAMPQKTDPVLTCWPLTINKLLSPISTLPGTKSRAIGQTIAAGALFCGG
jgi:hypothetical protein